LNENDSITSPFCSVVIPTIGRQSVERAVMSVLSQAFEPSDVEVIVVNDSGQPLLPAAWQDDRRVQVLETNRRERSIARNAGAAVAAGRYLCFLDDDDWLLPGALSELWKTARESSDSAWVYGGLRVVDEGGQILGEANSGLQGRCLAQVIGGAWVPLQGSLICADTFFRVGGFDASICGTEDQDLCRRVAVDGTFANTAAVVASLLRGRTWETSTDYLRAADDTRRSRDGVLNESGVYKRLLESASASPDSAYWFGRLLRIYWSSVGFNVQRRQVFAAASRAFLGVAVFFAAGRRTLTNRYWKGARARHVPGTLHFIVRDYEQRVGREPAAISRAG